MTRRGTTLCLMGLLTMLPAAAEAQSGWDVAAMAGVFAGRPDVPETSHSYDHWLHTGVGSVTLGRYLTPHLKLEVDASATGTGSMYVQRYVRVPGSVVDHPVGGEARLSVRSLGAAATWQFFDNEWVHPFVSAGVSADFDRRSLRFWEQSIYSGDPRGSGQQIVLTPASREGPATTTRLRGLVGGGTKLYVAERAFVRTDGRLTFGAGDWHVAFRVGIGVDF